MGLFDWMSRLFRGETPRASKRPHVSPLVVSRPKPRPEPAAAPTVEHELDSAVDDLFSDRKGPGSRVVVGGALDEENARRLFVEIVAQHARPVQDFVFELREGSASRRWIEICRPVLASVSEAAESMDLPELVAPLRELDRTLAAAANNRGSSLSQASRERILAIYDKLAAVEPEAFAIDEADRRRESIFLHSLLGQIPDVGYVTIEKLYRVGLTSLDGLSMATGRELHQTAGIPLELADRICTWLAEYRSSSTGLAPEELVKLQRRKVIELVAELRTHHEAFQKACEGASIDAALAISKRDFRRLRHACALQIESTLAELNELELAREVQKLAFAQRIPRLEQVIATWDVPASKPAAQKPTPASKPTVTQG